MKRLFLAMLFFGACASAQVPSFKSFNPTQFSTNNFIISITNGALVTNVNNIETLFINGTNIFNLFAPASAGVQNYWTNISNVLQPVAGTSVLVTNLSSVTTLASAGAFIIDSTLSQTLDLGTNCLDTLSQGGLALSGQTTDPNDTTFQLTLGNGNGQILVVHNLSANSAFTMLNGDPLCDGTPGGFVRLNGNWVTTTQGDGLLLYNTGLIWTEIGRFSGSTNVITGDQVWENVSGNIRPVNGNANNVLSFTSGLADNATNVAMVVGTTNLWSTSGSLLGRFHNAGTNRAVVTSSGRINVELGPDSGIPDDYGLSIVRKASDGFLNSGFYSQFIDGSTYDVNLYQDVTGSQLIVSNDGNENQVTLASYIASGGYLSLGVTNQSILTELFPGIASSGSAVAYLFDTSNVLTNGDTFVSIRNAGTPIFQFAPAEAGNPAGQIIFGPGTTNVLSRSGTDLVYTNSGTSSVSIQVRGGGSTKAASFGINSSSDASVMAATGEVVYLSPNAAASGSVIMSDVSGLRPDTDNVFDLGTFSSTGAWKDLYLKGKIYAQGSNDGAGNRTRLAIEHTGNAGNIEFRSEAAGTQTYRPFVFMSNTTAIASIQLDSGYTGAGTKFLSDDGTYKNGTSAVAEYLDADETNDTTTPDNLALSVTVTAAGEYAFTLTVFVDNSVDADGACIDFDGGDATMTSFRAQTKVFDSALALSSNSTALATDLCVATLTGTGSFEVSGGFTVNAGGTFIPRFFMNADTTGTLTAFRNSTLIVTAAQ